MNKIVTFCFLFTALTFSACAPTAAKQCESWKEGGLMPSPLQNCRICYDQLGGEDINAVRSCAFALDVNDAALGLK